MLVKFFRCFFVLLGVQSSLVSYGQGYAVKNFTVDDGLPSSHVYEVKQDSKGFYWICTTQGLVKYDGYRFEQVRKDKDLAAEEIWWTSEDHRGRIWCLYGGDKLWYIERDTFKYVKLELEELKKGAAFREIFVDKYDHCWISGGSGLYRYMADTLVHYKSYDLIGLKLLREAAFPGLYGKNDEICFVTKYPLSVWQPDSLGHLSKTFIYNDTIFSLNQQPLGKSEVLNEENTVFIYCSPDTLYTIHKGQLKGYIKGEEYDLGKFSSAEWMKYTNYKVLKLKNKFAFINSDNNFITDLDFNYLPEFSFMEGYNINTVYEDNEGGVWISTTDQGLLYITKDALAVKSFAGEAGLETGVVDVEIADNGDKWIAYKNGKLIRFGNDHISQYRVEPVNNIDRHWFVRDMEVFENFLLLAVGNFEVQVVNLGSIKGRILKPEKTFKFTHVRKIEKSSDNELFALDYYGIWQLHLETGEVDTILKEKSRAITLNEKGYYYISTFAGVNKYYPETMEATVLSNSVHLKKFVSNGSKDLWAIGNHGGVFRMVSDSVLEVLAFKDYLLHDLWFEGDTIIWAATNEGIVQFTYSSSAEDYEYSRKLTLAHGLLTNEVTALASDENYLYVGTSKGFNIVDKKKLTKPGLGYKVHLTEVTSKGESLGIQDQYKLPPSLNAIELGYVYISPKSEGQIKYQYKLEGIDEKWQETSKTSISYPFLPPGNYLFKLRAIDINGIPSSDNIRLNIQVSQYWWKTNWFRLATIIFLIALIILFYRIRIYRLRKKEKERNELNNRMAELKLNALQSQMDPHFVFNVLNGVQDSFISDNIIEANKYLSDFAKLMRLFLESSDKKYIPLDKEIKLLTYYIELERMRFKDKFEYSFEIADEVETDEMRVPAMLLQPVIENAIKHGLKHKEGLGKLIVEIDLDKTEVLHILVEDNGVGRKKAKEIKQQRSDAHMSKASGIIDERIQIINASEEGHIQIEYIDLMDGNKAIGTRVEIIIDLKINKP